MSINKKKKKINDSILESESLPFVWKHNRWFPVLIETSDRSDGTRMASRRTHRIASFKKEDFAFEASSGLEMQCCADGQCLKRCHPSWMLFSPNDMHAWMPIWPRESIFGSPKSLQCWRCNSGFWIVAYNRTRVGASNSHRLFMLLFLAHSYMPKLYMVLL